MSWIELKEQFRNLAERRAEWPDDWFYVLAVFDRIGAFHLGDKSSIAWECDQALRRVKVPKLQEWLQAVKAKATE